MCTGTRILLSFLGLPSCILTKGVCSDTILRTAYYFVRMMHGASLKQWLHTVLLIVAESGCELRHRRTTISKINLALRNSTRRTVKPHAMPQKKARGMKNKPGEKIKKGKQFTDLGSGRFHA